jgi:hypothetical protein
LSDDSCVVRFVTCANCGCAAKVTEVSCPHCSADLRAGDGGVLRHRTAILLGLTALAAPAIASCGDDDGAGGHGGSGTNSGSSAQFPSTAMSKYANAAIVSTGSSGSTTSSSGFDSDE